MLCVSVVLLVEENITHDCWKNESVHILSEHTMSSKDLAVFPQDREDNTLSRELIDHKPRCSSGKSRVSQIIELIFFQFHLSCANGLLISVKLSECIKLTFDIESIQNSAQQSLGCLVLESLIVLPVHISVWKCLEILLG